MSRADEFRDTTLDGYRVEGVVTETPELFVFAGRAEAGDPVTIRMARAPRGLSDGEFADASRVFATEAAQLTALARSSAHIEPLLAAGERTTSDGERVAYCIFARTDGTSLAQMRGRGAHSLGRALAALEPIAAALASAHEQGIFHGDVRPENLILVEAAQRPTIKLIRFGLATRFGSGSGSRSYAPEYGAPEHFKRSAGDSRLGPPTDVYGLALCLVELVTGRPPLDGSHPTELFKQATDITRRPTLRARGADVSQAVEAVVARALAVNPKLRWPNAGEFWAALVAVVEPDMRDESDPVAVSPDAMMEASGAASHASADRPSTPDQTSEDLVRRRVRVLLPMSLGLGLGFVVLALLLVFAKR